MQNPNPSPKNRNEKLFMGIDLGGTRARAGLVSNGQLTNSVSTLITGLHTEKEVLERIGALIEEAGLNEVAGIGVGVPSIVDAQQGIVYDTVNIPSWKEVHLKDILENKYHIPVSINNDANCFALGEQRYGAGRGYANLAGITIGTGLGAGIIIEDRLLNSKHCGVGEIGNIGYLDSTVEAYASGQFFTRVHGISGELLLSQALAGDGEAIAIFHEFGLHLGRAMLVTLYAYDPEIIVLGGSVSQSFQFFEKGMWESLQECVFPHALKTLRIECSQLRDIAVIGASCLVE